MNELTVILKDSSRTYKQEFTIYEVYTASPDDVQVRKCIDQAKKNFIGEPDRILIRIDFEVE
jgi:hypothetical protein